MNDSMPKGKKMMNGTNGVSISGPGVVADPPTARADFLGRDALQRAGAIGHAMGMLERNGNHQVACARCYKCLCLVVVDYESRRTFGVALNAPCDSRSLDKRTQFQREHAISDEHRAAIRKTEVREGSRPRKKA